jgi:hypothetical protein
VQFTGFALPCLKVLNSELKRQHSTPVGYITKKTYIEYLPTVRQVQDYNYADTRHKGAERS